MSEPLTFFSLKQTIPHIKSLPLKERNKIIIVEKGNWASEITRWNDQSTEEIRNVHLDDFIEKEGAENILMVSPKSVYFLTEERTDNEQIKEAQEVCKKISEESQMEYPRQSLINDYLNHIIAILREEQVQNVSVLEAFEELLDEVSHNPPSSQLDYTPSDK